MKCLTKNNERVVVVVKKMPQNAPSLCTKMIVMLFFNGKDGNKKEKERIRISVLMFNVVVVSVILLGLSWEIGNTVEVVRFCFGKR